jgi:hypothetical protein
MIISWSYLASRNSTIASANRAVCFTGERAAGYNHVERVPMHIKRAKTLHLHIY